MTTSNYPYFEYYDYDDIKYISTFPRKWLNHKPGTGPIDCRLCSKHGQINECFAGYCFSCAAYYEKMRGKGIIHTSHAGPRPPFYLNKQQQHVYKVIIEHHTKDFLNNLRPNINLKSIKEVPLPIYAVNIPQDILNTIPTEPENNYDWTADL